MVAIFPRPIRPGLVPGQKTAIRRLSMNNTTKKTKRLRRTVRLTYQDVGSITYNMGWELEDADAFWRLALKTQKAGAS
jgi:hypothetical protein